MTDKILKSVIDQIYSLLMQEDNKEKLKSVVIDPLVVYFKDRIKVFYLIIAIFLIGILITNVFILVYLVKVLSIVNINGSIN